MTLGLVLLGSLCLVPFLLELAGLAALRLFGAFLFSLSFWCGLVLLAALAYPLAHHAALRLGPQFMEDYGYPGFGFALIAGIVVFAADMFNGWKIARSLWAKIQMLFQSSTWTLWWRSYRVLARNGSVSFHTPFLWLAHARAHTGDRIQRRVAR